MPGSGGDDGRAEGYGTGAPARDGTLKPLLLNGVMELLHVTVKT